MARNRKDQGFLLVLTAFMVVAFVCLAALVLGIGVTAVSKSQFQNGANVAAFGALESWVSQAASGPPDLGMVKERVLEILAPNQPVGIENYIDPAAKVIFSWELEEHTESTIAEIDLGVFYAVNPSLDKQNPGPCWNNYPCFVYYSQPPVSAPVTAARVKVHTSGANKILAPFASILGKEKIDLEATATATLIQRCTAYLMDISATVTSDTHVMDVENQSNEFCNWGSVIRQPPAAGSFVYNKDNIDPAPSCLLGDSDAETGTDWRLQTAFVKERRLWCNTRTMRPKAGQPTPVTCPWNRTVPTDPTLTAFLEYNVPPILAGGSVNPEYLRYHYKDDYQEVAVKDRNTEKRLLVDLHRDAWYSGPEPLYTFLLAFNSALRQTKKQQTPFDLVTVKAFASGIVNEVPPVIGRDADYRKPLTSDLGYLIQVTNANNIGRWDGTKIVDEVHPNFLDHSWYPEVGNDKNKEFTDLVGALDKAIKDLNNACPASAKKQIVLATDGVPSCYLSAAGNPVCEDRNWGIYKTAEYQLLGQNPSLSSFAPGEWPPGAATGESILSRLIEHEIALTVLLSGDYVQPNFYNREDQTKPEKCDPAHCKYLDYVEARELGFRAFSLGSCGAQYTDCNFVKSVSKCPPGLSGEDCEREAYLSLGQSGYIFRRPNGVLAHLAMESGGLWCPLMPQDTTPSCYDGTHTMTDYCRDLKAEGLQTTSLDQRSKGFTAAECVARAVGFNPYLLAEPIKECSAAPAPDAMPGCAS